MKSTKQLTKQLIILNTLLTQVTRNHHTGTDLHYSDPMHSMGVETKTKMQSSVHNMQGNLMKVWICYIPNEIHGNIGIYNVLIVICGVLTILTNLVLRLKYMVSLNQKQNHYLTMYSCAEMGYFTHQQL